VEFGGLFFMDHPAYNSTD